MAKEPDVLKWVEELLPQDFLRKPMFGGFGYYIEDRIVLALFESPGDNSYKNKIFDFDIWNGCLFPVERENHTAILKKFPFLSTHPVLTKWLYLPVDTENFDSNVALVLKEIKRRSEFFGVIPKSKKPKKMRTLPKNKTVNMKTPHMFRDEEPKVFLKKARKISDLKNLGPSAEKEFSKAGIKTADQFIKMGWKKALTQLVQSNKKNRHTVFTYALIGALKNQDWNRLSESDKLEAKKFTASLKNKK